MKGLRVGLVSDDFDGVSFLVDVVRAYDVDIACLASTSVHSAAATAIPVALVDQDLGESEVKRTCQFLRENGTTLFAAVCGRVGPRGGYGFGWARQVTKPVSMTGAVYMAKWLHSVTRGAEPS